MRYAGLIIIAILMAAIPTGMVMGKKEYVQTVSYVPQEPQDTSVAEIERELIRDIVARERLEVFCFASRDPNEPAITGYVEPETGIARFDSEENLERCGTTALQ
jgi:hypothetical protein